VIHDKPFGLIYADAPQPGSIAVSPNDLKLLHNQTPLAIKQAM
jgi:hypothetical protein